MISLCVNKYEICSAIEAVKGSGYLKSVIYCYLESYGTEFCFNEFFLQYSEDKVTSVILRYNSYLYLICDDDADSEELSSFLCGFSDSVLVCDFNPFDDNYSVKSCYLMSLRGVKNESVTNVQDLSDSPKSISDLVCDGMIQSHRDNFFLNTSHMLRHGTLRAFGCFVREKAVAVSGFTREYNGVSAVIFVYTHVNFRGNGFSRKVLNHVCSVFDSEFQLLCEEHNLEFYKKCGFKQISVCYEIRL